MDTLMKLNRENSHFYKFILQLLLYLTVSNKPVAFAVSSAMLRFSTDNGLSTKFGAFMFVLFVLHLLSLFGIVSINGVQSIYAFISMAGYASGHAKTTTEEKMAMSMAALIFYDRLDLFVLYVVSATIYRILFQ